MKRLFKRFDHREAYAWFERHGVRLVTQEDDCVFPASQDSHTIIKLQAQSSMLKVSKGRPFDLPGRLWSYLLTKTLGERAQNRWENLNKKEVNRLVNILCNDPYQIAGRAAFKDEFVTCGGVSLSAVDPNTLESKDTPHLYFAGEVLDIDGITGGFNFQAAWTTAYTVAQAINSVILSKHDTFVD